MKRQPSALVAFCMLAVALVFAAAGCGRDGQSEETTSAAPESAVPFDRAFIDAMVPHHESAIEMAEAALTAGLAQPDLVRIAEDVIATQQAEIDQMLEWRGRWYGSSEVDPAGALSLGLSVEEMGAMEHGAHELGSADDVEAAFARLMIEHHQGAIRMASLALDEAERSEIRDLAEAILDAQSGEIEIMRKHAAGGGP